MNPTAKAELVPTGKLRVGVNLGNFLLVNKDPASRRPSSCARSGTMPRG
jgi:hypothetical protein